MGKRFQCARVAVPLNWYRPAGPQIKLAVIRFLGSDQKHRLGSMFVNPGGPGSSGVGIVKDIGPMLSAWGRGRFNVVGWDPRGTNASDPVRCFISQAAEARFWRGVQTPVTAVASRAFARRAAALSRRCGQVSGQLLDNISTEDTARDLNRLRQLVGDRKLTYVGLSYGSMIGQTYENMFPGRVRAMLLDGIVDPVEIHRQRREQARRPGRIGRRGLLPPVREAVSACRSVPLCARRSLRDRRPARRAPVPAGAPRADPGAAREASRCARPLRSAAQHVHSAADTGRLAPARRGSQCRGER
jgi:pimeloyl-ACP methyl ester carboxylesterase